MNRKNHILLLLCLLFVPGLYATEPCMKEVKSCYARLSELSKTPLGKQVYYVSYTVRAVSVDSSASLPVSTVQMWINKNGLMIKSRDMEVYQDEADVFTLLPRQKLILRSQTLPASMARHEAKRFGMIQDTIFAVSKVLSCKQNGALKTIVIEPSARAKERMNLDKLTFVINSAQGRIEKIRLEYTTAYIQQQANKVKVLEYTFNDLSFDYQGQKPAAQVKKKFVDHQNRLTAAYTQAGFKYMDNRKKKKDKSSDHS